MKNLLEKLNNKTQKNIEGKPYFLSGMSLLVLYIQGDDYYDELEDTKEILDKMLLDYPKAKYVGVGLKDTVSYKKRLEIFQFVTEYNFKEAKIEVKKDTCFYSVNNHVGKHSIVKIINFIANRLLSLKLSFKDVDHNKLSFDGLHREIRTPLSKMKMVSLYELPKTTEEAETYNEENQIHGDVFKVDVKALKKKFLYDFYITDSTESAKVKVFSEDVLDVQVGDFLTAWGKLKYDKYDNDVAFMAYKIDVSKAKEEVMSECNNKRTELHVHSNYDTMDATATVDDYYKLAKNRGVKALAVLDKENVLNFFDSEEASKKYGIKPIYGVEANLINEDHFKIFYNNGEHSMSFVGVDIETTDLSNRFGDIIEIGAYKEVNGEKLTFNRLINRPGGDNTVSEFTTSLTGITKEMLDANGVELEDALKDFLEFVGDSIIIAHNATFDIGFLERKLHMLGYSTRFSFIDTMNLSRAILKLRSNTLDHVAEKLHVSLLNHHRAFDDAKCCYEIFKGLMSILLDNEVSEDHIGESLIDLRTTTEKAYNSVNALGLEIVSQERIEELKCGYLTTVRVPDIKDALDEISKIKSLKVQRIYVKDSRYENDLELLNELITDDIILKNARGNTITILVKNQKGIKELYDIISLSHTKRITRRGVVLFKKDLLAYKTDNLLVGSSTRSGLFENLYFGEKVDINLYDYFEINPPKSYLAVSNDINMDRINFILRNIYEMTLKLNKPCILASNAHYLNKSDDGLYEVLQNTDMVGGVKHKYKDSVDNGDLSYLDTNEMVKSVSEVFNVEEVSKLVYENPDYISSLIADDIKISKDELYVPTDDFLKDKELDILDGENVASIKNKFLSMIKESLKAYEVDGVLPELVKNRVKREVTPIIEHGYHIVYYISYLLVKKSLRDGYSVGSRGSVGSSFVANLMGITEVNALKPHYRCPKCHFQLYKGEKKSFPEVSGIDNLIENLNSVLSGFDLKLERCPVCGEIMIRDGHDIPFETFLGFNGDKVPDIDLNFASVYQSTAHAFTKELFGEDQVVRAGTISKLADKTAYNAVLAYYLKKEKTISSAEALRQAMGLVDIKRTTGQHASGIIVVPEGMRYEDFTPVQYPANDKEAWLTTHFEYSKIHDNLLKLDILGHIDPTVLKALMDEVKKNPSEYPFDNIKDIPICDPKVFDLLRKDKDGIINALGISEFGTHFVMGMLEKIKIESFADLVKVSGLSHGTDVWQNNGEDLISGATKFGALEFKEIIGCRDDIMTGLIGFGVENKDAFDIMEFVRKGKLHKPGGAIKWDNYKNIMIEKGVPEWYIYSLSKIKYMFPKAHAIAYVMSALRIAWFKAYKPTVFYKVYFSIRDKKFDVETITTNDLDLIDKKIEEYDEFGAEKSDRDKVPMLQLAREAISKGIRILKPDVNESLPCEFKIIDDNTLLTPFNMIPGVGDEMAKRFVLKKEGRIIESLEDLESIKAPKKIIEGLGF